MAKASDKKPSRPVKATKAGASRGKAASASAKAKAAKVKAAKAKAAKAKAAKAKAAKAKAAKAKAAKAKAAEAKAAKAKAAKAKAAKAKAATEKATRRATARAEVAQENAAREAPAKLKTTSKAPTTRRSGGAKKTIKSDSMAAHSIRRKKRWKLEELLDVGRSVMGIEDLRAGQADALEHILKRRNVLAVMPTGSGKSLLYQLPSLVLPGLTVVVSPLIALIKDQIDKMEALGVAVVRIDSTLTIKQRRAMNELAMAPGGRLLLTTPERMADPEFREFLSRASEGVGVSLFVVDEAHCVSQWGHDFRPSYLELRKAIEDLGYPPILATTATAPPHVREDILHQLGIEKAEIVTTSFDRPNLHYECIAVPGDDDKNNSLVTLLKRLPRPGVVYCATVKKVEELFESMSRHGVPVARYHGRMTKKERDSNQNAFMDAKSDLVMIATNAFGLGVDKSDIRYVLHYHVPGSLEAYAQEAGRGGRDGKPARCVLLFSPDDVAIQEYFLKGTYPTRRQVRAVYGALSAWGTHEEAEPTVSNLALASRVGTQRTRTVLSLLKDEGFVVEHDGAVYSIADPPPDEKTLTEKAKQYEARRMADRQRLDALLEYVGTPGCRSQVILSYLGEDAPPLCGRCDNCLRSRDAALAASREATLLEDGVIRQLAEEEGDLGLPRTKRLVKARVVRIDKPDVALTSPQEDAASNASPRRSRGTDSGAPIPPETDRDAELARLAREQNADDSDGRQARDVLEDADGSFEDEFEDEFEDDDEYYEEDEDDEYDEEDDGVEELAIEKTAAQLVAEGYTPEEAEITILARKKQPKPPKKKKVLEPEPTPKKKKRRRRRKKSTLPSKDSFTSPVLVKEAGSKVEERKKRRRSSASAAPLVEYVRGPLRINMTPVASATPNDVAKRKAKGSKRRRRPGSPSVSQSPASAPSTVMPSADATEIPAGESNGKKKRRRRRRRKKRGGGDDTVNLDAPIDFFSSSTNSPAGSGAGGNGGRRRRRRRKRGRGKRGDAGTSAPGGSE